MKLSIIMPVLNEAAVIRDTLRSLQSLRRAGHEVIIVDGGSHDNTMKLAGGLADKLLDSLPGRARQMNRGAAAARGDVFLFVHADTILPPQVDIIFNSFSNESDFWGRFDVRLSGQRLLFRIIEWFINFRSRYSGIATGDQAMFVSAKLFHQVQGFPEIALMEDIAISRLLKKRCAPSCLRHKVITSSRRWEEQGIITTVIKMWKLRLLYTLGADPNKLARDYE